MSDMGRVFKELKNIGAVKLRQKGTHQVWRLPSGARYTVSVSRKNHSNAGNRALAQLKRLLRGDL